MFSSRSTFSPALVAGFAPAVLVAAPGAGWSQTKISVGMPTTPPNIVHMPCPSQWTSASIR